VVEKMLQWAKLSEVTGGDGGIWRLPLYPFFHQIVCKTELSIGVKYSRR